MNLVTQKALEVKNVEKSYGKVHVLKNLSVYVEDRQFLVLLGPSGCGKTTLLRIIAGLTPLDAGSVWLSGRDITNIPVHKRDIGMVFQNYALFPHMNVFRNIAFGLRMRHIPADKIKGRVEESLRIVHLEGLGDRNISQLSGGQQQRVALARALVLQPSLLLMDEPLSNLDAKLRASVRVEIAQIQKQLGITSILVTHDQVEAMTMGDIIVLMREGVIQQAAPPNQIYEKPANVFTASFIGSPSINLFNLEVEGERVLLSETGERIPADAISLALRWEDKPEGIPSGKYIIGIRPEDMMLDANPAADGVILRSTVFFIETLGSDTYIHLKIRDKNIIVRSTEHNSSYKAGDILGIRFCPASAHLFNAGNEERVKFCG